MRRLCPRLFLPIFVILGLALPPAMPAGAQEGPKTILVLDASGSMWGQIDGKAKITIAQEVISDLLRTLPPEQQLGLTVYGHRRKGDCGDIETLVQPGPNSREAIARAVNGIKPKGKTPLSDAVTRAAEELRYTEDAATVILVSDGKETCGRNTCRVGSALEEAGVDFTAHVVGFDVSDVKVQDQLKCLAENTGGRFLSAANAAELGRALVEVAKAPPPDLDVRFSAREEGTNAPLTDGLVWQLRDQESGAYLVEMVETDAIGMKLKPGRYLAEVLRIKDEAYAQLDVVIRQGGKRDFQLTLPEFRPLAELEAPERAVAGATIDILWEGPNAELDYLATANAGDRGSQTITYSYTSGGSPLKLQMPPEPGLYELRYVLNDGSKVLARKVIEVVPFEVDIDLPEQAVAGETLMLNWTGPNYNLDYLSTANPGDRGSQAITYSYTRDGSPLGLEMPATPGTYEVRYVLNQGNTVAFSKTIEVVPFEVDIDLPEQAVAGETLMLNWTGPNYNLDYLSTANPGDRGSQTITYSYTRDGSPLGLEMPATPGTYEVRYVLNQGNTVAFSKTIEVVPFTVSIEVPDRVRAGETLALNWSGPNYNLDYIATANPGDRGSQTITYSYTRGGNPLEVTMPPTPGTYEIRYVLNQGNKVAFAKTIEVLPVTASLNAPASAVAGQTVSVDWQGPNYNLDYLSVANPGDRGSQTINYVYSRNGSPLGIEMPPTPGTYEIRYVLNQGNTVLARRTITVTPVSASLNAPASGMAGAEISIGWEGPNYHLDYISLAEPGSRGSATVTYAYTRNGSPLSLVLPDMPGTYELRYVMRQGNTVLARQNITVK